MRPGSVAMRTMQALADVDDTREVAAMLVGTIYELALRLDKTPRTIADDAFCTIADDTRWRERISPALLEALGRD